MALIDQFADLFEQTPPADVADAADDRMNTGSVAVADDCGICGRGDDIRNHPQRSANTQSRSSTSDPQYPQVPQGAYPQTPAKGTALTDEDRQRIRAWLDLIEEHDPGIRAEVLDMCQRSDKARAYYLARAAEVEPQNEAPVRWGELRPCSWCVELNRRTGICEAAKRGLLATRSYTPQPDIPRRCDHYTARLKAVRGTEGNR